MALSKRESKKRHYRIFMLVVLLLALAGGYFWYEGQTQDPISPLHSEQVQAKTIVLSPLASSEDILPHGDATLKEQVAAVEEEANATYGIAVKNLTTGETYTERAQESFTMASTYKPPLVLTALIDIEKGKLDPNKKISYWTIIQASEMIITRSEEDLAEILGDILGWNHVQQVAQSFGMKQTFFDERFSTTPEDQIILLEKIYKGEGMSQTVRDQLYTMLLHQQINDRLPKYLPPEAQVAHKTGELNDVRHDVGIITVGKQTYVLALMAKDAASPEDTKEALAKLSLVFYKHFVGQ